MTGHVRLSLDLLSVDRSASEPMHRQIYAALRGHILEGRLPAHAVLPSTRTLAEDLKVGRNTVIAAYDQLLAEGFIEARTGSGTWVAPIRAPRRAESPALNGHAPRRLSRRGTIIAEGGVTPHRRAAINLTPGRPDVGSFPFSVWSNLLARNARRTDEMAGSAVEMAGMPALRQAIADTIGLSRGIDCSPDQVIVLTGSQAGLDLIARVLMDDGDGVWHEEPGYIGARSAFLAAGARLAPLRIGDGGWQFDDTELPTPRLIYVTPSGQWPLGMVMRIEERLQLLDIAGRTGAWIIEDDYDAEHRLRGRPIPALRGLDRADRVIYVGSFGKTLLPAIRIGYLIVPRSLAAAFAQALSVTGQFSPLVLQATVADFIRHGYFATHLKRMRRLYQKRQAFFAKLCEQQLGRWIKVSSHDPGMQLLLWMRGTLEDTAVAAQAAAEGLEVGVISTMYYRDPPRHGLLLGYAALDEREMQRAVTALRAAFERASA